MMAKRSLLAAVCTLLALTVHGHAQTRGDAQRIWIEALDRLAELEQAANSVFVLATIDRRVQRMGEEKPTVVTKAIAKIWTTSEKYRVELENEISMESPAPHLPYTPTGIQRHTITFDGATVCQAIDMDNGERIGRDHGREYSLPLLFAGFPSADPTRPWMNSLQLGPLKSREFRCELLNSGIVRAQATEGEQGLLDQQLFYLSPGSHKIIRHEKWNSSKELVTSIDLSWEDSADTLYVKRFVRNCMTRSSQFPDAAFKDITRYEVLDFRTDAEMPDRWLSIDSLGVERDSND